MRTIHRGIWLTPLHNEPRIAQISRYLIGSTYRWHPLDGLPSDEARQEILSKFSRWFKLPFEVVNHRSAIRPTSFDQRPLLGASSIETRIWVLNGLGAKGSLLAPWCAEQLVNCMMDRTDISPSLSWNRRHL
jgi:glycine/D-amino acid oxidase-like deaminating enzyme